ncbi:hypothetical protein [Ructibacterium gallinarum]|uniref:Uncharacterized protein n=1 Tax=Ructibacterium gallinarum TaxID=2779355 RepID=A0A9D5LXX5_9FIRM|nr:hypothetical protein [Ructibacterium gallinarum]MBE5039978.1 hypothetical protein [Ructibacterium gallinarum]
MYRRYDPKPRTPAVQGVSGKPPVLPERQRTNVHTPQSPNQSGRNGSRDFRRNENKNRPPVQPAAEKNQSNHSKKLKLPQNPLLGLIPSSVYDPKTKKVLGFFSAEDMLLVALILLLMEQEDSENNMLIYALLYVLLSDYIDLPF